MSAWVTSFVPPLRLSPAVLGLGCSFCGCFELSSAILFVSFVVDYVYRLLAAGCLGKLQEFCDIVSQDYGMFFDPKAVFVAPLDGRGQLRLC